MTVLAIPELEAVRVTTVVLTSKDGRSLLRIRQKFPVAPNAVRRTMTR